MSDGNDNEESDQMLVTKEENGLKTSLLKEALLYCVPHTNVVIAHLKIVINIVLCNWSLFFPTLGCFL
jgi:hypothetical protein